MAAAFEREESPAAKDAIRQILVNSRMAAEGRRPICQDTGIVTVFLTIGMDVRWDGATMSLDDMVNEGVRRAYTNPDNPLRESIVRDPAGARLNTRDNTPAIIHHKLVPGETFGVHVMAKGGGGEAKAHFAVLNPSDSIVEWILRTVPTMGAGWCPPGMLGIGIGGNPEKAMELAPTDVDALRRLSDIALRQGRIDAALNLARRAVAANPAEPHSHNHEASVLLAAGDYAGAHESLAKALKLAPSDVTFLRRADFLRALSEGGIHPAAAT